MDSASYLYLWKYASFNMPSAFSQLYSMDLPLCFGFIFVQVNYMYTLPRFVWTHRSILCSLPPPPPSEVKGAANLKCYPRTITALITNPTTPYTLKEKPSPPLYTYSVWIIQILLYISWLNQPCHYCRYKLCIQTEKVKVHTKNFVQCVNDI